MAKVSLLFLAAYIVANVDAAFPCSCASSGGPATAFHESDAVFSGTVVDITPSGNYGQIVTFDVDRTWKGSNEPTISISQEGTTCDFSFSAGQSWLVYAYGKSSLSTNVCTETKPLENAQQDLSVLGTGQIAPPPAPPQSKAVWVAFTLCVGAVVAWITMWLKR